MQVRWFYELHGFCLVTVMTALNSYLRLEKGVEVPRKKNRIIYYIQKHETIKWRKVTMFMYSEFLTVQTQEKLSNFVHFSH